MELTLPHMTCGHCEKAVTAAVKSVDPEALVQVDLPSHRVRIHSAQPEAAILAALKAAGYEPG